jgi:hypothetical protein
MCAFCAFFASRLGLRDIPDATAGRPRQPVLLTPSIPSQPTQLPSRQQSAPLTPLAAALTNLPPSIANKRLTQSLNPLDSTLTRNRGAGVALQPLVTSFHPYLVPSSHRLNIQTCNSFPVTSLAAPPCNFHRITSSQKPWGGGPPVFSQRSDVPTCHSLPPYFLTSFRPLIDSTFKPANVQPALLS